MVVELSAGGSVEEVVAAMVATVGSNMVADAVPASEAVAAELVAAPAVATIAELVAALAVASATELVAAAVTAAAVAVAPDGLESAIIPELLWAASTPFLLLIPSARIARELIGTSSCCSCANTLQQQVRKDSERTVTAALRVRKQKTSKCLCWLRIILVVGITGSVTLKRAQKVVVLKSNLIQRESYLHGLPTHLRVLQYLYRASKVAASLAIFGAAGMAPVGLRR